MKSAPLIINWHESNLPIYSADFQKGERGRLATGGGDNNVRIWRLEYEGEERRIEYLATLAKHSQAVNCVRWAPRGGVLASAGDDGNVILWVLDDGKTHTPAFGGDGIDDKEVWRTKHMCRSSGAEIYDLAWSPDANYFIIGSMDNIARIYSAQTGSLIRQIAEHQHYVQGVTWDPLNEYIATQSSDRSVHIYTLRTKDGQFTLDNREEPRRIGINLKMDLPGRRISSNSPVPPDFGSRSQLTDSQSNAIGSPGPSCPGTPTSLALPMNPPSVISHSRRSSFGASSPAMSMRRSASPAPSLPLPAVMPMEASPKPYAGLGMKNANIYANDTLKSFFRRLTFTPDGSLLFTPAGQYQTQHRGLDESTKTSYEVINTVYIYTRGGINKPPVAHLPGHKKPSVAVKCSPLYYTARKSAPPPTTHITIDTSSAEDTLLPLPDPIVPNSPAHSEMEPPPTIPQNTNSLEPMSSPKSKQSEAETNAASPGPNMAFSLPYRMIYAVATEDSVLLYDTQQQTPICVVSNLHCATFTDLTWSTDGLTLLMTSSDGFCSTLTFSPGELGQPYTGEVPSLKTSTPHSTPHINSSSNHINTTATSSSSSQNTPIPTPTSIAPPSPFHNPSQTHHRTPSYPIAPSPPPYNSNYTANVRPPSPTRSNSTSSVATQSSYAVSSVISNPPLVSGSIPSVSTSNSTASIPGSGVGSSTGGAPTGTVSGVGLGLSSVPMNTPPQTPRSTTGSVSGSVTGLKRDASESEKEEAGTKEPEKKKRRIAPTAVPDGS